ncbi:nucleoprotein TPR-like [Ruditapes philippinarum]|uniref:nucleoprotein TPR-like n=1 Tax=Ruditapes philippinarum TaxID=129788 RepID=UPI00295B8FAB|nr:nucleoprotein TPR-like [Ruditapes philippinarum]
MSKFLSLSIGLLFSWICQVRCAESELSAKVVYELLSLRIDNVVRENNNLKSELKETKAVVYKLENKIERMEANISFTASRVTSYEEENSTTLLNEKIQAFEDLSATRLQKQFKTEAILLRKMLVNEKSHMKDKLMAFEQKFNSFQSDLVNNLNEMNTSIETTVDNLEKTIYEHNITTITRLVSIEDKLQSQLNETDLLIQEMNEDFQHKLTESDARIEEGNIKLSENINEVDQRLTAAKTNLQSTYSGLNNRLYSAESVSSSLQSTYSGLNSRLNSAESKLRSVSSLQDRQENTFSGQISALSRRISEEEGKS